MPEPVAIRVLGSGDAEVLWRVAPGVFDADVDARLAAEFVADPRHHLAVALADGVVVGMASGVTYVHPDKPAQMFVNEVGVAPKYRRCGTGSRLLEALLSRGKVVGCVEAWLATEPSNTVAQAFYTTAGWDVAPEPAVVFSLRLDASHGASVER